jgi:phenylalanyl-tRNA synthetase alpha chain
MPPKKKSEYSVPKLKDFSAAALDEAVQNLLAAVVREAGEVKNELEWKTFRDRWMARANGFLTQVNTLWLKAAPKDAKRDVGQRVNEVKKRVDETIAAALASMQSAASTSQLDTERVDITLPGIRRPLGAEHPVIKTMNEMVGCFAILGTPWKKGRRLRRIITISRR